MHFLLQVVALFAVGLSHASVIPIAGQIEQDVIPGIASETLVQGPSTKTRLLGPDGSQIAADAPGGRILNEPVGIVAVPVVAARAIAVEPVVEVPAAVVAQPVVPVVKTVEPIAVAPVVANVLSEQGPIVTETIVSSDEGQYVPDNTEKLYDDGSYKEPTTVEASDDGSYKEPATEENNDEH